MILWINGAFGSGKTVTAWELHRRLPGSHVYDPENAGFFLWKNEPASIKKPNFQDEPLWREINVACLLHIARTFEGTVIAPMTLYHPAYYQEIIGALRGEGVKVCHVLLGAGPDTLARRRKSRLDGPRSFAAQMADTCLRGFADPVFENQLCTDDLTVEQAAELVARTAGFSLAPDTLGPLGRRLYRLRVQLRHIRG